MMKPAKYLFIFICLAFVGGCGKQVDSDLGEMQLELKAITTTLGIQPDVIEPPKTKRESVILKVVFSGDAVSNVRANLDRSLASQGYGRKIIEADKNNGSGEAILYCHNKIPHRFATWKVAADGKTAWFSLRAVGFENLTPNCSNAIVINESN